MCTIYKVYMYLFLMWLFFLPFINVSCHHKLRPFPFLCTSAIIERKEEKEERKKKSQPLSVTAPSWKLFFLAASIREGPSTFWNTWFQIHQPGRTSSNMCLNACGSFLGMDASSPEQHGKTSKRLVSLTFTSSMLRRMMSPSSLDLILWDTPLNDWLESSIDSSIFTEKGTDMLQQTRILATVHLLSKNIFIYLQNKQQFTVCSSPLPHQRCTQ